MQHSSTSSSFSSLSPPPPPPLPFHKRYAAEEDDDDEDKAQPPVKRPRIPVGTDEYRTALYSATISGNRDAVSDLLKAADGVESNSSSSSGSKVPLYHADVLQAATRAGRVEIVELLLDRKADMHYANDKALEQATRFGFTKIVRCLLERVEDFEIPVLWKMCLEAEKQGRVDLAKMLETCADKLAAATAATTGLDQQDHPSPQRSRKATNHDNAMLLEGAKVGKVTRRFSLVDYEKKMLWKAFLVAEQYKHDSLMRHIRNRAVQVLVREQR